MKLSCVDIAMAAALGPGNKIGQELLFTCPCHDDKHPSLSINNEKNVWLCGPCGKSGGPWALAAFLSGNPPEEKRAITEWLRERGLLESADNGPRLVCTYVYEDEDRKPLSRVERYEPKDFRQSRPNGTGGWTPGVKDVRRVPYRLPDFLPHETVYIVEGEKDADALWELEIPATTNPMGARKWRDDFSPYFRAKQVVILADNDDEGREHARQVAVSLFPVAKAVKIVELPGLPPKGDVSDFLASGGNRERLAEIVKAVAIVTSEEVGTWKSEGSSKKGPFVASVAYVAEPLESEIKMSEWPVLAPEAYHGLAGEFIKTVEPETEADPAAILIQLLLYFGNAIGRSAHFVVEADRHSLNEYATLVGRTSKGRKGTSRGHVTKVFEAIDPDWVRDRIQIGLSSGEGLIWAVRDPIEKTEAVKEKGRFTGEYQTVQSDPGVTDKRVLIVEEEFASTLRVLNRDGNNLSAVIRGAWDSGDLRTLTKNSPAKATGAHISIIGHISKDELLRYLDRTEAGNGFGNRILWACVRRSKVLPEGGSVDPAALEALTHRFRDAVSFARRAREIRRDDEARQVWYEVYPELSAEKLGLLGALIARGEAHVMRLAAIYALLDSATVIRKEHLFAALAVWEYCEASAGYIFGEALGDPVADELLKAIRHSTDGLTRTEIRDFFKRHQSKNQIDRAVGLLLSQGLIRSAKEETGGRPIERFFSLRGTATKATKGGLCRRDRDELSSDCKECEPFQEDRSGTASAWSCCPEGAY